MARLATVSALETYLKAEHPAVTFIGLLDEDADRPAEGGTFVAIQYPVSDAEQASLGAPGSNVYRHTGTIRLVVNQKRAVANAREAAVTMCDTLAASLRGKDISGVLTFAPTDPVFDDRNEDGLYQVFSFSTPFQHDLIG